MPEKGTLKGVGDVVTALKSGYVERVTTPPTEIRSNITPQDIKDAYAGAAGEVGGYSPGQLIAMSGTTAEITARKTQENLTKRLYQKGAEQRHRAQER